MNDIKCCAQYKNQTLPVKTDKVIIKRSQKTTFATILIFFTNYIFIHNNSTPDFYEGPLFYIKH